MALLDIVTKGSSDRSVTVRVIDATDGTPETGVVWNTSGIDLWYRREGAAKTSITEATLAALTTAHADGGFLHIADGEYRLDLPDAAFATAANYVDIGGTVTGMVVIGGRVRLIDADIEDGVRLGLTALPNAAADAAGGLPISDAGGLDLDALESTVSSLSSDIADIAVAQASLIGSTTATTLTPTSWSTSIARPDGALVGRVCYFLGGATNGEAAVITGYDNANGLITTTDALTTSPSNGATILIRDYAMSTADVLAQVNAALDAAISELGVGAPAAEPSTRTALMLMYMMARNQLIVQTSGTDAIEVHNDAGTKIASKLITDAGGDYTEAKMS